MSRNILLVYIIILSLLFSGCVTQSEESQQSSEINEYSSPFEDSIYQESDVDLVIATEKSFNGQENLLTAFLEQNQLTERNTQLYVFTPFTTSVNNLFYSNIYFEETTDRDIQNTLLSDETYIHVIMHTDNPHYSDDGFVALVIKEENTTYKAHSLDVISEYKYPIDTGRRVNQPMPYYETTITGYVPGYENIAKKQVECVVVIDGIQTLVNINISKFK